MNDVEQIIRKHGGKVICPSTKVYLEWLTGQLHEDGTLPKSLEVDHEFFPETGNVQLFLRKIDDSDVINDDSYKSIYMAVSLCYKERRDEFNNLRNV